MTVPFRTRTALALACGGLLAAGTTAAFVVDDAPAAAPAVEVAAEGLCVDLSQLKLPSLCVGRLLGG